MDQSRSKVSSCQAFLLESLDGPLVDMIYDISDDVMLSLACRQRGMLQTLVTTTKENKGRVYMFL